MNRTPASSTLNAGQALIAAAKLILFFALPMIALNLPLLGEVYALRGMDLYNQYGVSICLILLILYAVMLLFSLGPFQKLSLVPALAALVLEIIVMANAGSLLPFDRLSALLPREAASYLAQGERVLKTFFRPATGLTVSMILTVVYAVFQFVPILSVQSAGGKN